MFLKKNLMKIFFFFLENLNFSKELKTLKFFSFSFSFFLSLFFFFFLKNFEILNFFKELKILIDDFFFFFFFGSNLRSMSSMPLVPRPFLKISFFFFLKDLQRIDFFFEI